ncbi:MAG TPA: hypothetical protein VGI67_04510 [Thermoleophilaceae bacterium]
MSYFSKVRLYSAFESLIFIALLVSWIGGMSAHTQLVLGWIHGVGWTILCIAVAVGCRRGVFPWVLLAATVSPIGPLGSSIGIEILHRQRMSSPASG